MPQKLTKLSELGEFGLIERIAKTVNIKHASTIRGIGDDAAILKYNETTVITTDLLVEGVHFDLTYTPLKHLGYKAVIVNLSDIYAMNATPKHITVSMALSSRFSLEAIDEIYKGMRLACDTYNVDIVGGDTSSSQAGLVISITAIGEANEKNIVRRDTANNDDLICVSGDLGSAYLGLLILKREKQIFVENPDIQPDLTGNDYILQRQLKPEARGDIIKKLRDISVLPTSMIDISDGLASEIIHICRASNTGCILYEDSLPIQAESHEKAREFNLDPTMCILNGGEDYELLFTVNKDNIDAIKKIREITIIGEIVDKQQGYMLELKQGTKHPITAQGWDSFINKK